MYRRHIMAKTKIVTRDKKGVAISPLYGVLIVILTSPFFGVFSCGWLVKEAAACSGNVCKY